MADDTRANLTKGSTWTRLLYIILYSITFKVAGFVVAIITLIQFVTALLNGGTPNKRLQDLGRVLAAYLRDVTAYLTYESDEKPFPIGDWPDTEPAQPAAEPKPKPKPKPKKVTKKE